MKPYLAVDSAPNVKSLYLISFKDITVAEADILVGYMNNDARLNERQKLESDGHVLTSTEYIHGVEAWCAKKLAHMYAIMLARRPIGTISLVLPVKGRARTGYWLASDYWGQGLGQQAFNLILQEANRAGANEIAASIEVSNLPSLNIWRRLGAHEKASQKAGMTDMVLKLPIDNTVEEVAACVT